MAWERGRGEDASCAKAWRGPVERGPVERGPVERGPVERGPVVSGRGAYVGAEGVAALRWGALRFTHALALRFAHARALHSAHALALLVAFALVLGGLAGCGGDGDSGEADGERGEPDAPRELEPGFPAASGDVLAWGDARRGLPWPFELRGLAAAQGSVWVYVISREPEAAPEGASGDGSEGPGGAGGAGGAPRVGSGLFRLDPADWSWRRAAPPLPRGTAQQMITGPDDRLYVRAASAVWRHDEGEWTPLPSLPEGRNPVLLAHPDAMPDHLAAMIGDAASPTLVRIAIDDPPQRDTPDPADADPADADPANADPGDADPADADPADADPAAAWEVVFTDVGTIPDSGPVGAVLGHDGALYVARRWPIRDSQGATGAVFRGTAAGWEDVTWNLRDTRDNGMPIHMLNATGNGWGPFGGIDIGPNGRGLVAWSEQGAFRMDPDARTWVPLAAIWYGARAVGIGSYVFLGKDRLERWLDDLRHQSVGLGRAPGWGARMQRLVSPDGGTTLVGHWRDSDGNGASRREFETLLVVRIPDDAPITSRSLDLEHATQHQADGFDAVVGVHVVGDDVIVAWNEGPDDAVTGNVRRLAADGAVRAELTVEEPIGAIAVDTAGVAWVAIGSAVHALDDALLPGPVRWSADAPIRRLAVGPGGAHAALAAQTLWVHDAAGTRSTAIGRNYVEDVAIGDDVGLLWIVGFDNRRRDGVPVQVAYLEARAIDTLAWSWQRWAHATDDLGDNMADTRLYRVHRGADGLLYALGEVAGGNSIFRWNGVDLTTPTLVAYDPFTDASNTGSEHKGYVARLDPTGGAVLAGQLIIPRLSNGRGNTFRTQRGAIAVDAQGTIAIAGTSTARSAGRDLQLVNGEPVGTYSGADPSVLVIAPDLRSRLLWTTFVRTEGRGELNAIALDPARIAVAGVRTGGRWFASVEPATPPEVPEDRRDLWYGWWRRPALNAAGP